MRLTMKFIALLFVLLLASLSSPLKAQKDATGNCNPDRSCSGQISASGSTCSTVNACVVLPLPLNTGTVTLSLAGTFSGTLPFEQSVNGGISWISAQGIPLPLGTA